MVNMLYLVLPLVVFLILLFSLFYYARRKRLIEEGEEPDQPLPIVKIILAITAIIISVYIIMSYELALWQQGVIAVMLIVVSWFIYRHKKKTPSPPGQPQARLDNWWNSLKSKISFGNIAILLAAVIAVLLAYNNFIGTPEKVYSARELQNFTTSDNWKLQNDELVCNGNYYQKCKIIIPNEGNIGGFTVDPGLNPLPNIDISFGDKYLIKYFHKFETDCDGRRDGKKYYQAEIYYDGIANSIFCSNQQDGGAAQKLWIGTLYYRLLANFPGGPWDGAEDPKVSIGGWVIRASYINEKNQRYLSQNISLSSSQQTHIVSLTVSPASYSWKELFCKITGIKI